MKIAVLSDTEGRLIGIAPVHDPGDGPVGRIVAQKGQVLHEIDVDEDLLADADRLARLHETHRVSEGRLVSRS
ncbi:hypothetical protein [Kutzneria kofuensis]|uniref:Uncharacterized protein n=1 Tax=Kutzneria kofuensis TaxID=103725 RepID=A0A7W9NLR1_9PSEU|nr:hypothetical protein [Kutzneria kofuensis]MBB5897039.1 hypothetical protein [Kutzneria kofuensis]